MRSPTNDPMTSAERRAGAALASIFALRMLGLFLILPVFSIYAKDLPGGDDVALVIGGPDGIEPEFRKAAHERIRLSDMTLPHAFARVLLIEQLYRAWSVNAGHPYHRE